MYKKVYVMKKLLLSSVMIFFANPIYAENYLSDMKISGFVSDYHPKDMIPIQTSITNVFKEIGDVNSLKYIYGYPYDKDFGGDESRLDGAYTTYNVIGSSSLSKFNQDDFVEKWTLMKNSAVNFIETPSAGRFKPEDFVLDGVVDVKSQNLWGDDTSDLIIPPSAFVGWRYTASLNVETSGNLAIVFNSLTERWNGGEWGDFKNNRWDFAGDTEYKYCHTFIILNGEQIDSSSTETNRDGRTRMLKMLPSVQEGKYDLVAEVICPTSYYQRINFLSMGVVDVDTREPLPSYPAEERPTKTPKRGKIPEVNQIDRVGFTRWSWWKEDQLEMTDMDLLIEDNQAFGLSNSSHVKQIMVEDRFFPKEEGVYQLLLETESNTCLATQVTYGKVSCAGVLHPSYYVSFEERDVQLAGGAFHSASPHRKDLASFVVEKDDIRYGMPFVLSVRGRLPWKDSYETREIYIADIEQDYAPRIEVDGKSLPAAVRVTNSLSDAKAIQKVRLWIKGPSDSKFRPLYDYDFQENK